MTTFEEVRKHNSRLVRSLKKNTDFVYFRNENDDSFILTGFYLEEYDSFARKNGLAMNTTCLRGYRGTFILNGKQRSFKACYHRLVKGAEWGSAYYK